MLVAQVEDWLTIADFSPGVYSDWHEAKTSYSTAAPRNGAAVAGSTFRCTADKMGALVPLPKVSGTYTRRVPFVDHGTTTTTNFPNSVAKAVLLDAVVSGPIVPAISSIPLIERLQGYEPEAVYTLWGIVYYNAATSQWFQYARGTAIGLFNGAVPFDYMMTRGLNPISGIYTFPGGCLDKTRGTVSAGSFDPVQYRSAVVGCVSMDRAMAGIAGACVTGGAMTTDESDRTNYDTVTSRNGSAPSANFYGASHFSSPNLNGTVGALVVSPTANVGSFNLPAGATAFSLLCSHQGRVVYAQRGITPTYGPSSLGYHSADFIAYTPVGDFSGAGANAIWGEEGASPIGAMLSMSANELLIIRHYGGGVLVRGDLDNPQVYRLPLAHSTGGYMAKACHTPVGVFYATRDGIVRWAGGDTTEIASKQLRGDFWVPHSEYIEGMHGRLAWWNPYVLAPNGYLLNTETGGWWRLDNPATPYSHYDVSAWNGKLYAFPYKAQGDGVQTWWDTFEVDKLASTYSWRSQPILETLEREFNCAEIEITAQRMANSMSVSGDAYVTVTLTGYTAEGTLVTSSNTFNLASTYGPQTLVQAVDSNFVARFVQIGIYADSDDADMPAPKIFNVRLGRSARARIGRS